MTYVCHVKVTVKVRDATAVIEFNDERLVSPTQQHPAHGKVGIVSLNIFANRVRFIPPTLRRASFNTGA